MSVHVVSFRITLQVGWTTVTTDVSVGPRILVWVG